MHASEKSAEQIDCAHQLRLRRQSQRELCDDATDFMTKFLALHHIQSLASGHPTLLDPETVRLVGRILLERKFKRQRQGYFFYRQAAETLRSIVIHASEPALGDLAYGSLITALRATDGSAHRSTAEALGSLPCAVAGPALQPEIPDRLPEFRWHRVLAELDLTPCGPPRLAGRSLLLPVREGERLLVAKLSRHADDLLLESVWMNYFHRSRKRFPARFKSPQPMQILERDVFKLASLPRMPGIRGVPAGRYAFIYLTDPEYFVYPNDHRSGNRSLDLGEFREVMRQNARQLGSLASMGIVHAAPIPLFHNRQQIHRRQDQGRYQWYRAGRLDRWLDSCAFPNLAPTGIRDFEHFISLNGGGRLLYRYIGQHLISLLLICGSYFRGRKPELRGRDRCGRPVDARHLFDRGAFKDCVLQIFLGYHRGFAGFDFDEALPLDLERLVTRMIEEMGVDRHMEEILRVADQKEMSDEAFRKFLNRYRPAGIDLRTTVKGVEDIVFSSGPHLGGFNRQISLPEMIEAVETLAAVCVGGRFRQESGLGSISGRAIVPHADAV
jgi:hypothetical protein